MAQGVDLLIAAGHISKYEGYSLRQMQNFISLFQKRTKMMMRDTAVAMRVGHHAEGKDFKQFLEDDS